jgi:uncharacterized membrane protein
MKKKIIIIGWILLGALFVGLFTIAVVAFLQGEGARPWKLVRGGKGGHYFPIEFLTVFLVVIVVGLYWVINRFMALSRKNQKTNLDEPEI